MSATIEGLSLTDKFGLAGILQGFTFTSRDTQPRVSPLSPGARIAVPVMRSMAPDQSGHTMAWSLRLSKNLDRLRQLSYGWDGPGSLPIDSSLINRVNALIRETLSSLGEKALAPFVVPLSSGGVQVEWHTGRGKLEFELGADGAATIWVRDHSTGHEFETNGAKALNQFLRWAPQLAEQVDGTDVPHAREAAYVAVAA